MSKIIAVANQKGGTAKTTTACTFAHYFALQGLRVLIVDTDPQGNVAFSFGVARAPGLYRLLCTNTPLDDIAIEARPNLDLIVSDKTTETAQRIIAAQDFREKAIANALQGAPYDLIFLDLAPSISAIHVAALVASNFVVVVSELDAMSVHGVNDLLTSLAELASYGHTIEDYAILPTFFDRQTNETIVQLQALVDAFHGRVWPPIPRSTQVREASAHGQTLWEFCPRSTAIAGYQNGNGPRIGGYSNALQRFSEEVLHHA